MGYGRVRTIMLAMMVMWPLTAWANHDGQEDICHSAAVIFCENWEDRVVGFAFVGNAAHTDLRRAKYKNGGWDFPFPWPIAVAGDGRGQGVSTSQARDGTKSFESHWPAGRLCCTGYILSWFGSGRDLYARIYSRFSTNYKVSPIGNRQFALVNADAAGGTTGAAHIFTNTFGETKPSHKTTRAALDWILLPQNVGTPLSYANNVWYCQEIHIRQSSGVNVANGLVEGWVDDVLLWNYPNQIISDHPENFQSFWFDGRYNCEEPEDGNGNCGGTGSGGAHPDMSRWHDNFVVSTQRIGCLGSAPPPSDTTPPLTPTNLRVSSLWDQLLKVFWTLQ